MYVYYIYVLFFHFSHYFNETTYEQMRKWIYSLTNVCRMSNTIRSETTRQSAVKKESTSYGSSVGLKSKSALSIREIRYLEMMRMIFIQNRGRRFPSISGWGSSYFNIS